ncbi:hypothetical protein CRG98_030483 [Punica granatum]|uniref:Uncharacterized protein n=1 Tax=Punica granatum TaxID=22663 RepID=A0A2I0IYP3_PUNGR|nr:hypothetical protein CRG98_030483 [Punica granatum]
MQLKVFLNLIKGENGRNFPKKNSLFIPGLDARVWSWTKLEQRQSEQLSKTPPPGLVEARAVEARMVEARALAEQEEIAEAELRKAEASSLDRRRLGTRRNRYWQNKNFKKKCQTTEQEEIEEARTIGDLED